MNDKKCVIVLTVYKDQITYDEEQSLHRLFKILGKYHIVLIHPESLDISYYMQYDFISYIGLEDRYFQDFPKGYNQLMMNEEFYRRFDSYKYMLIYQLDCWVFNDKLEYWCDKDYDYIGAPWLFNEEGNRSYLTRGDYSFISECVGNGGFSLRKISWMISEIKYKRNIIDELLNTYEENEDVIISTLFYGNIAPFAEAVKFAWESNPYNSYQIIDFNIPFGLHKYKEVDGICNFYTYFNMIEYEEPVDYTKNMVFYIYCPSYEDKKIPDCIKLHLVCIKRILENFDNINILLGFDNPNNEEFTNLYISYINSYLDYPNINYICVKNNIIYREGIHFFNYVLQNLLNLKGITYFYHSKGLYDIDSKVLDCTEDAIYNWILMQYFENFYNVEDIQNKLLNEDYVLAGGLKIINNTVYYHAKFRYMGSGYWINTKKVHYKLLEFGKWKKYLQRNDFNMRICAEDFIPKVLDEKYAYTPFNTICHNISKYYEGSPYRHSNMIYDTLNENQKQEFEIYKQDILEEYNKLL